MSAACGEIKNKLQMERKWSNVLGSMGQNYYSFGIESGNEKDIWKHAFIVPVSK